MIRFPLSYYFHFYQFPYSSTGSRDATRSPSEQNLRWPSEKKKTILNFPGFMLEISKLTTPCPMCRCFCENLCALHCLDVCMHQTLFHLRASVAHTLLFVCIVYGTHHISSNCLRSKCVHMRSCMYVCVCFEQTILNYKTGKSNRKIFFLCIVMVACLVKSVEQLLFSVHSTCMFYAMTFAVMREMQGLLTKLGKFPINM